MITRIPAAGNKRGLFLPARIFGFTKYRKYASIFFKADNVCRIRETHRTREYMCSAALQRIPRRRGSGAEREGAGADGRWLGRGAAEASVGSDRTACYSGRVSVSREQAPMRSAEELVPVEASGCEAEAKRSGNTGRTRLLNEKAIFYIIGKYYLSRRD